VLGDDGQLMEIVFLTMKRTSKDEFEVTGKSKVKTNICDFKGTMRILKEEILNDHEVIDVDGKATGTYLFNEDKSQKGTGTFKGKFEIYWLNYENTSWLNKKNGFGFADMASDDAVSFIGNWTSYATKKSKKANWCDIGSCGPVTYNDGQEVIIEEKYRSKGWEKYMGEYIGEAYGGKYSWYMGHINITDREIWWKKK
jgi:hypothetical protein